MCAPFPGESALITAIVPAAGLSTRMGGDVSKPLLPWGKGTIIEQVVSTLNITLADVPSNVLVVRMFDYPTTSAIA